MLQIKNLHVSVEGNEILRGITLQIRPGEVHAIMGPNGSGKSTLAYTIAGHPKYTVDSGTITLDGQDVLAMTVDERARVDDIHALAEIYFRVLDGYFRA